MAMKTILDVRVKVQADKNLAGDARDVRCFFLDPVTGESAKMIRVEDLVIVAAYVVQICGNNAVEGWDHAVEMILRNAKRWENPNKTKQQTKEDSE